MLLDSNLAMTQNSKIEMPGIINNYYAVENKAEADNDEAAYYNLHISTRNKVINPSMIDDLLTNINNKSCYRMIKQQIS